MQKHRLVVVSCCLHVCGGHFWDMWVGPVVMAVPFVQSVVAVGGCVMVWDLWAQQAGNLRRWGFAMGPWGLGQGRLGGVGLMFWPPKW